MNTTEHRAQIGRQKKDRRRALFSGDWLASSVGTEGHASTFNTHALAEVLVNFDEGGGDSAFISEANWQ